VTSLKALLPWRLRSLNNLVLSSPNAFFSGVRTTAPMPVAPDSPVELHALVCKRDVNMMLTSAKSLLRYCPPVCLVLHDDGSLGDDDCELLSEHLPGVRIIRRADADDEMQRVLAPAVFQKRQQHFFLVKLLDFNHFNRGTHTLMLDSDILFLKEPTEVLRWMMEPAPRPFYNRDPSPTYRASLVPDGLLLPEHLNAGFLGFGGRFELGEITRWCIEVDYWQEDQTIYALLLSGKQALALDPERYRVYLGEPITERTAMVHFISPKRFERLLYPRLARRIFRSLRRPT
jgi:hypothetical protein